VPFALPAWDRALFTLLNGEWRAPLFDVVLPVFSWSWLIWVAGGVAAFFLVRRGGRRALLPVLCVVLAVILADTATGQLKDAFCRTRPLNSLPLTWLQEDGHWQQRPADFTPPFEECGSSFPSGHATNTMALAVAVILLWGRRARWIFFLPLVTGWSRIYLGKHFPSDVMAGWVMGAAAATLVWALWCAARKILAKRAAG